MDLQDLSTSSKFLPLNNTAPISLPPPPASGSWFYSVFYQFCFFGFHTLMISLSICLCLTLMLSIMASRSIGPSILLQMAKFTFFLLWLNNIPLYVYTPIFSIHLLMGTCFPLLTAMNKRCNTHGIAHLSLTSYFHFLWVYTQRWNCWITWQFYF